MCLWWCEYRGKIRVIVLGGIVGLLGIVGIGKMRVSEKDKKDYIK